MKFRKPTFVFFWLIFMLSCSLPRNATSQPSQAADRDSLMRSSPAYAAAGSYEEAGETHGAASDKNPVSNKKPDLTATGQARKPEAKKAAGLLGSTDAQENDIIEQQELLEQALDLLNQSQRFWQRGDIDNSLRCLDEAYGLILEVNGDPETSRQKDDLRLIISKRIIEISSSKHTTVTGKTSEIPLLVNDDVEREIRSFQTVERGFFLRSYHRSGLVREAILKHLKEAGLPKELSWLPLVESGFQINALSRARALGLWQFIPSTGYKYALQRDRWIDERLDVEKSTKAAIAYLKELHGLFGDWLTALAAYNCGEGRVLRVISKQHINYLDHFWDLYRQLPNETARYVPRFLATLHIIRDPKKYGFDFGEIEKPLRYETVKTGKCMRLQDIATHLSISKEVLCFLNSELKLQMTPESDYLLKVPSGKSVLLASSLDSIPRWEPPRQAARAKGSVVRHRVKRGESMKSIARRYRSSVNEIMDFNDLSSRRVKIGQVLRVPVRGYAKKAKGKVKTVKTRKRASVADDAEHKQRTSRHKVKKGDTIVSIARKYGTTTDEIRKLNGISGSRIKINESLKVPKNQ
ncbi:MAG: LysM peptidoglycan-binding domain-containing protein [Syntrophales bacterium]|nr:LysM peptidoglycan-binding domain-containing protein [Syntrophales bacterium]MDD5532091.1 LysM peptidoglycan-binding domain-containing protein [Syntrophales bacterium]